MTMSLGTRFQSVLAAAEAGAEWALAELYSDLQPQLLRYFSVQAWAEAEDLAAEVWIDAARGLSRFEGDEAAFRRWLFTIAHRRLVDFRRRSARRREEPLPAELMAGHSAGGEWALDPVSDGTLACLAALPPLHAEIVLLRVIGGFDSNEVARIVGKKPGTVRVVQKRALERLAELLTESSTPVVTR
jgi:RNA polymerase sigma-70 factor, ECF subfamily